jgi:hypothetical protein
VPVPKADDPIAVQVQTFPTGAFDSAMGAMVSDTDLTRAHGTAGVTGGSFMPALVGSNGIEHLLAGNGTVAAAASRWEPAPASAASAESAARLHKRSLARWHRSAQQWEQ